MFDDDAEKPGVSRGGGMRERREKTSHRGQETPQSRNLSTSETKKEGKIRRNQRTEIFFFGGGGGGWGITFFIPSNPLAD